MSDEEEANVPTEGTDEQEEDPNQEDFCRLCAKNIKGEESISIFDDNLHESLDELLGIGVGVSDVWPKRVCPKCIRKATKSIKFVRGVRKSEALFKRLFGANGPVVEFVVKEVSGGVEMDFNSDSDDVEVISDDEAFPEDGVMIKEEGEAPDDTDDSIPYLKASDPIPEAYLEMEYTAEQPYIEPQNEDEDALPAVLAPRRRYKTDADFRRVEAYYTLNCMYCLIHFTRLKELRAHYREMHHQEGFVLCCGKKLFRLTYMLDHMEYHANPEAFKCDQCGKCTDSQLHLRTHQQQAHPGIYSRRKKVIERLSEATKLNRFPCEYCGREFDYKCAMERHVAQIHQGGIYETCSVCCKQFKCRISYQRHMRLHEMEMSAGNVFVDETDQAVLIN
ncbi:zinc finger protein 287-like [Lutzomyia longipalpis]|uniref:zinc finger protein 287-like n=1 Tax=Lutzomyia longipalpis TaxID=7200 RepID=UPI0024836D22|nr:zinc finger protein 287-like [Lutzomyia longipalpis]